MAVVVLGAGVAGESFVSAFRRLDESRPLTVIERELAGGECSYWACIPSKTMLRPFEVAGRGRVAPGVRIDGVDVPQVFAWRDKVAEKDDTSQVEWLQGMGVQFVRGQAEVAEPGRVDAAGTAYEYDDLVVATGSSPAMPPLEGLDEVGPWTSRDATSAPEIPESLTVVGGGAVGCEMAQFYARAGSQVTLIQSGPYLMERVDEDAGNLLAEALRTDGVEVITNTKPTSVERANGRMRLRCDGHESEVEATQVLIATGRNANTDGFGLERLPVEIVKAGIAVDERLRAGEGVWAVGDVTGVSQFTHVGKYQGRIAAANVAGGEARADYRAIPASVFTDPQVASVGDTSGKGAVTSTRSIEQVSRASTYAKPKRPGFVKLFADESRGVLVGAVVVGPEAGEWLGQLTLAVRAEVPVETLRDTIQPFPTFSEAIFFAARDLPL
jgi:pyruvate/2-oxoglutarate dehydrogenase complex dihydrolipoamide dehydrogenase (E3) component